MTTRYVSLGDTFTHKECRHVHVTYMPGKQCKLPAYLVENKADSTWISYGKHIKLPKTTDKLAWERRLGVPLKPLKN